jgi:hypothetical protein
MKRFAPEPIPNGWRVRLPLASTPEPPAQSVQKEASAPTRSKASRSKRDQAQPRRSKERSQET